MISMYTISAVKIKKVKPVIKSTVFRLRISTATLISSVA